MTMIGNIYDQTTTPIRSPLVLSASENLNMQILELNDRVNVLISRLSSVSREPVPCAAEKSGKAIKETTPLSATLDDYAERIFKMRSDVNDAIDRLEI